MRNRHFEVKIVKDNPSELPPPPTCPPCKRVQLNRDNVQAAATLVGVGYAAKKAIDTLTEIALHTAKAKIK